VACGDGVDRAVVDADDDVTGCETVELPSSGDPGVGPGTPLDPSPLVSPAPVPVAVAPPATAPEPAKGGRRERRATPSSRPTRPPPRPATDGQGVAPAVAVVAAVIAVSAAGEASVPVRCDEAADCRGTIYIDPAPAGAKKDAAGTTGGGGANGNGNGKGKGREARGSAPRARAARRGRFGRRVFVVPSGREARVPVRLSRAVLRRLGAPGRGTARSARRGRSVKAQVTIDVGRSPAGQAHRRPAPLGAYPSACGWAHGSRRRTRAQP
jgi:hypothetical protein